jgi:hypothetical protein
MRETSYDQGGARPGGFSIPFGRRGLILSAMALIGAGLWLNWGWVAAIGAAPLILALAPCAVMCGLGLCMKGGRNPAPPPRVRTPVRKPRGTDPRHDQKE